MKFTSIASGSKGNAYLVESDGVASLLLECGIPIRQLREKLKFGLSDIAGCLISQEHGDHSKAVKELITAGVDCYMSYGTAQALGILEHYRVRLSGKIPPSSFCGWDILPFILEHDATEPIGFLIGHGDERLLFVPDTGYIKNRFTGITIVAIECNFIEDILSENIQKGHIPSVVGHRVRHNHMSLETLIEMLKCNDLSKCRTIYLLHLSDGNSDEKRMIKTVQEAVGIPCFAC